MKHQTELPLHLTYSDEMKVEDAYTSEEDLVKDLNRGVAAAYEQLVRGHAHRLLRMAYRRLGNREDAEDLVQDLMTEVWTNRESLSIHSSLSAYLNVSLRNRILNYIRRADLHQQAIKNLLERMETMQASIGDVLAAKDLNRMLSEVVAELPDNMQKIFTLRGEDFSLKEIAQALGLSEKTVKTYSSELSRRIRTSIAAKYPDI